MLKLNFLTAIFKDFDHIISLILCRIAMLKNIYFCRTPSLICRAAMLKNIYFCRTPSLICRTAMLKNIYFCRTPSLICRTAMLKNISFCRTPSLIFFTVIALNPGSRTRVILKYMSKRKRGKDFFSFGFKKNKPKNNQVS